MTANIPYTILILIHLNLEMGKLIFVSGPVWLAGKRKEISHKLAQILNYKILHQDSFLNSGSDEFSDPINAIDWKKMGEAISSNNDQDNNLVVEGFCLRSDLLLHHSPDRHYHIMPIHTTHFVTIDELLVRNKNAVIDNIRKKQKSEELVTKMWDFYIDTILKTQTDIGYLLDMVSGDGKEIPVDKILTSNLTTE